MPYLPIELWRHVFEYLLPVHEVSKVHYANFSNKHYSWLTHPPLHLAANEDPVLAFTVQCLITSPDLLFPSSDIVYWEVLIPKVSWTIGSSTELISGGYVGNIYGLRALQHTYNVSVKHVIVVLDTTRCGTDDEEIETLDTALQDAQAAKDAFPQLKSMNFYVDIHAHSARPGVGIFHETTKGLLCWLFALEGLPEVGESWGVPPWFLQRERERDVTSWREDLISRGGSSRFWVRTEVDRCSSSCRTRSHQPPFAQTFAPTLLEDITTVFDEMLMPKRRLLGRLAKGEDFEAHFDEVFDVLHAAFTS